MSNARNLVALAAFVLPAAALADHGPPPAATVPASTVAGEVLAQMMQDNTRFAAAHAQGYYDRFRDAQHPRATVLGCADSRFQTNDFFAEPDDRLFTIRNIGNQVRTNLGSVEYGVRHLHTPVLIVVGHVGCGAVKAAMGDYGAESDAIERELDPLHLSLLHTHAEGPDDVRWLRNVIGNVHEQVDEARRRFAAEVAADKLVVVGALYDFRNDLGTGVGKLVVINVNGETDLMKLAELPFLRAGKVIPATCAGCHEHPKPGSPIVQLHKHLAEAAHARKAKAAPHQ